MKPFILSFLVLIFACGSGPNSQPADTNQPEVHKVEVAEVLQTGEYTYLRVKEGDTEQWVAAAKMSASAGDFYYYKGGLLMKEFESKELKRTFKEVLFLDQISSNPDFTPSGVSMANLNEHKAGLLNIHEAGATPVHKVVVSEVLQTSKYTYLRVIEDGIESWLAVTKMEASAGQTYYYQNGALMTNFESKELKRNFKEIFFIDNINSNPGVFMAEAPASGSVPATGNNPNTKAEKKPINLEHAKGEITIAEIFKNKQSYSGKTVKIKAQVTKFNPSILNRNWIHVQDGTDASGKFDLTITTDMEAKVGEIITMEGKIVLDKDFGAGYSYEVLMEEAKILK